MVTRAERIGFRVEQHHYALALIVMHQEEPEDWNKGGDQHHRNTNQTPAQAREKQDKQTGQGDQNRGSEVRLRGDQQRGQENQHQRNGGIFQRWRTHVAVDKARHHQRYGYFSDFRRLEANDAEIQPALRPFGNGAEGINRHQQNNTENIEIGRPAFIDPRRDLRHDDHNNNPHSDLADFTLHHAHILTAGAPDNQRAVGQQRQQDKQHGGIEVDFIP